MELDKSRKLLLAVVVVGVVVVMIGITVSALGVEHWELTAWIFLLCLVNTVLIVGLYLRNLLSDVYEVID